MVPTGSAPPTAEAPSRAVLASASTHPQRYPLDPGNGSSLARLTRIVWLVAHRLQPLLSLAASPHLGKHPGGTAAPCGSPKTAGLVRAIFLDHDRGRSPTRRAGHS